VPGVPAPGEAPAEIKVPVAGGEATIEVRSLPLVFDDAPAALTIAREVTEVRRMQTQLLLTDRMASVGTLAAGVAHEINNPLSYVLANVGFAIGALRDGRRGITDSELLEALGDAMQGGERVSRIVKDLKTFSRGDDERRTPVSLHAALDLSVQMTASAFRGKVKLVKSYGEVPPVDANESRLGQVFVNLLINASQALSDDGRPHMIEISTQTDYAGRAVVAVRDTGKGIPPEVLDRIFDPFFTTKPVGVGTGLGLSICHNIIQWLGGEIIVHSRLGIGTTFTITLPASSSHVPANPVPPPALVKPPARRGRVLVVDDEPMVGVAVKRTLEAEAEVEFETSARVALRRVTGGERFDLVLCDLMMPEMNGVELHDAIEKVSPDQLERLVFLTGAIANGEGGILGGRRRPHIDKPFDPTVLRRVVRDYVEHGQYAFA
jgi:two-component system, cell cycle sensor histidine kinase and response regulator CckA